MFAVRAAAGVFAVCFVACAAEGLDAAETLILARRDRVRAVCACEPDQDACVAREAESRRSEQCTLEAFRAVRRTLAPALACEADAEEAATRCLDDGGCGDAARCGAEREAALEACHAEDPADVRRFHHARFVCLGTPGCPALSAAGVGQPLREGTVTVDTSDDHEAPCAGVGGRDVSIAWTAPADASYRIDTMGSEYDTVLAIFDDCEAPFPRVCDDDDADLAGEVFVAAEAGETFLLVIDAFDGSPEATGRWALNVVAVE